MNNTETVTALHMTAARLRHRGFDAARIGHTILVVLEPGLRAYVHIEGNGYAGRTETRGQGSHFFSGLNLPALVDVLATK